MLRVIVPALLAVVVGNIFYRVLQLKDPEALLFQGAAGLIFLILCYATFRGIRSMMTHRSALKNDPVDCDVAVIEQHVWVRDRDSDADNFSHSSRERKTSYHIEIVINGQGWRGPISPNLGDNSHIGKRGPGKAWLSETNGVPVEVEFMGKRIVLFPEPTVFEPEKAAA